jgi:hypothetical protein
MVFNLPYSVFQKPVNVVIVTSPTRHFLQDLPRSLYFRRVSPCLMLIISFRYFYKDLVRTVNDDCTTLDTSNMIADSSVFSWQVYLSVISIWIIVYFCVWKGVKSSSYVVWVTVPTPLLFICIMVVKGFTLPGMNLGIRMYLLGHN